MNRLTRALNVTIVTVRLYLCSVLVACTNQDKSANAKNGSFIERVTQLLNSRLHRQTQAGGQPDRQKNKTTKQTSKQTDKPTDRQTYRQAERRNASLLFDIWKLICFMLSKTHRHKQAGKKKDTDSSQKNRRTER